MMMGKGLPYDAEVEWIESTGTQFIRTQVIADTNTRVKVEFQLTDLFTDNAVISMDSGRSNNRSFTLEYTETSGIVFSMDGKSPLYNTLDVPLDTATWYSVDASANYMQVNDIRVSGGSIVSFNGQYYLLLFAYGRRGTPLIYGKSRIKKLAIYINDIMLCDYIAVRVGQVGYLYDKVSGELFGNVGTGSFVVGPDKVNP
jgi:hypothetical protein